ncbi:MAG: hypothetical protein EPN79_11155 [Burkholderiaceae bacterium]|nr:MAG: hypothetical protein EPN79_11155 [Burkholderiaceae bacterium]TBR76758.1 MAG: hypothetical protein EPN64_05920 [Burkholderiaceae bacterium]
MAGNLAGINPELTRAMPRKRTNFLYLCDGDVMPPRITIPEEKSFQGMVLCAAANFGFDFAEKI